jgi:sporulation protein YlmC with PRC-barrel domain
MQPLLKPLKVISFTASLLALAVLNGPSFSQGVPQTLSMTKIDPQTLATGYRTSKIIGSVVVNEANENLGNIDDLIVTPSETIPFAVLAIGGFLGIGATYVVVPYEDIQVDDNRMLLRGATKESLKALPPFKYRS